MTTETLQKANEINSKIEELVDDIDYMCSIMNKHDHYILKVGGLDIDESDHKECIISINLTSKILNTVIDKKQKQLDKLRFELEKL